MHFRVKLLATAAAAILSSISSVPAGASTLSLSAILLGGNECIAGPMCAQGDLDAFGIASITVPTGAGGNAICFSILVDDVDPPTAAHIHGGVATVNGAVIVALAPPASGNPGTASGCVATPAGFTKALIKDPAAFYVNVHTAAFPGGAMRGQVF